MNSEFWQRYDPSDSQQRLSEDTRNARLAAGNSLTYNDLLSEAYGTMRRSHNEGIHGVLATRWKLTFGKRYFKTIEQVQIEACMIFSAMHVCAIEHARDVQATTAIAA